MRFMRAAFTLAETIARGTGFVRSGAGRHRTVWREKPDLESQNAAPPMPQLNIDKPHLNPR